MKLERADGVLVLRMDAGKANAIGEAFLDALERRLDEVDAAGPGALVVTGYGTFFSAGLDLPSLVHLDRAGIARFIGRFARAMLRVFELGRPVVAAVNGHAVAGGCVLALMADERIMAAAEGKIGLTEVRLGIGLPSAVTEALRGQVPAASLGPIALEGRLFAAAEAAALGLVHAVAPPGELEARALARARELGALPAEAYAQIKAALRKPAAEAARREAAAQDARWADTWVSAEGQRRLREAVEALGRKKPPRP